MQRIESVRLRLENWALWCERQSRGGLGYPSRSAFMVERVDGGYRDTHIPVDENEAAKTHDAVESLRAGKSHLHRALTLHYLRGMSHKQIAQAMCKAESTVKGYFPAADAVLAQWFASKADAARRVAVSAGGFTT